MATSLLQPMSSCFPLRRHISPTNTQSETRSDAVVPNKASLAFILSAFAEDQSPSHTSVSRSTVPANVRQWRDHQRVCAIDGCTKQAKLHKKCWRHGGSRECKFSGCGNRAKKRSLCWAHGGGKACSVANCRTIAVSKGVCWAHGGGKRCRMARCSRPAYGSAENLCKVHSEPIKTGEQNYCKLILLEEATL